MEADNLTRFQKLAKDVQQKARELNDALDALAAAGMQATINVYEMHRLGLSYPRHEIHIDSSLPL